jgi:nucleotide-binding universal stress UspA family protein
MSPITHILVPVDFDQTSAHALDYALSLAKQTGARVTAIHVFGLAVLNALDAEYIPTASRASQLSEDAQKQLDALIGPRKDRGVELVSELRVGSAAEEIVSRATELKVDLIVVGKHTRGMLERALVGSVATQVIRHAEIPVLTVRST